MIAKQKIKLGETEKKLQKRTDDSRIQKSVFEEAAPIADKGDKVFRKVYCCFKRKIQMKTLLIKIRSQSASNCLGPQERGRDG